MNIAEVIRARQQEPRQQGHSQRRIALTSTAGESVVLFEVGHVSLKPFYLGEERLILVGELGNTRSLGIDVDLGDILNLLGALGKSEHAKGFVAALFGGRDVTHNRSEGVPAERGTWRLTLTVVECRSFAALVRTPALGRVPVLARPPVLARAPALARTASASAVHAAAWSFKLCRGRATSVSALITFPSAESERLICAPSFNLLPVAPVAFARSDPARSTSEILDHLRVRPSASSASQLVTEKEMTACERLLCSFMLVRPTARRCSASLISSSTEVAESTVSSTNPSTNTPRPPTSSRIHTARYAHGAPVGVSRPNLCKQVGDEARDDASAVARCVTLA
eukprot:3651361-Pleurochrysis_carterae.AAC.1